MGIITVSELAREFANRVEIFDLRYTLDKWCVMIPKDGMMAVLHGTLSNGPEESLRRAIERWDDPEPYKP